MLLWVCFFFFNDTATTEIYTLSLHDALPICGLDVRVLVDILAGASAGGINAVFLAEAIASGRSLEPLTELWLERSEEHTSELQSRQYLVCRLLLEKKKKQSDLRQQHTITEHR